MPATIEYTPTARAHIAALHRHYEELERPEAIRNLLAAVRDAEARIARSPAIGLAAPRPYPEIIRPNWRWLKTGRYWFGYIHAGTAATIAAVFHDSADIPNRL
jgi:plasmid stabilization system protein ParE